MPDFLINAVLVLAAVILGGLTLQFFRQPQGGAGAPDQSAALEALRTENTRLEKDLARAVAHLEKARDDLQRMTEDARHQSQQLNDITEERNTLDRRVVKETEAYKALEARLVDLREAKDRMALEFKEVAGQLMKSHSETFKTQNKEQIDALLSPLGKEIKEFKEGVTKAHEKSLEQHSALDQHIKMLSERSVELSHETENLTKALKGDSKLQGDWGQHVLENILLSSGLREGEEYTKEETHIDENGKQVRTDFIVKLPNGDRVIIDSKVAIKHYELAMKADTSEERDRHLDEHTRKVKKHIKDLADKDYHKKAGSRLDFVIMFMPIEPALGAAFQRDDKIGYYAAENKISIATPTTLIAVLKTIASIWRVERQNKFAEKIASQAGSLYDKFCGFLADLENVGAAIDKAGMAYSDARKKLATGRGNLVRQTKQLEDLGAKITKSIPEDWIEDDEGPRLIETSVRKDSDAA